jgi:hypothetical protein
MRPIIGTTEKNALRHAIPDAYAEYEPSATAEAFTQLLRWCLWYFGQSRPIG